MKFSYLCLTENKQQKRKRNTICYSQNLPLNTDSFSHLGYGPKNWPFLSIYGENWSKDQKEMKQELAVRQGHGAGYEITGQGNHR